MKEYFVLTEHSSLVSCDDPAQGWRVFHTQYNPDSPTISAIRGLESPRRDELFLMYNSSGTL